jgi:hypothetical protein
VEQAVTNQEADRRLLAAFINGLIGALGKQVRLQIPEIIDKALNMAIIATKAEKEEKASVREDWGTSARVFTVEGSRGVYHEIDTRIDMGNPEESCNGAVIEVPGRSTRLDRHNTRQE